MEAKAEHKYAGISPRKVKIVCDLIRDKDTATAKAILLLLVIAGITGTQLVLTKRKEVEM